MKEKRTQKKSDAVTAPDFQKTNYLKTNLLKQIKNISFLNAKIASFSLPTKLFRIKMQRY